MVYDPYEKIGLRRTINAATCLTSLGGSMPDPSVFEAMLDASKAFISIPELQTWAGERLAESFDAESGLPTAGAVNSLMLACAACMLRDTELKEHDPLGISDWTHIIQRLPRCTDDLPSEFVVLGDSRSEYDHAIEAAGGTRVEAGTRTGVTVDALEEVFHTGETAAYYYTLYAFKDQMPLHEFVKVAHSHNVPVIVDAAPCLTHKAVPRKILDTGADLVIFSGGKQMGAPNNSGILIGREDLINLAHLNAYPFDGIGRAAKMSRETIMGLVKAMELFVERDDNAYYETMLEETHEFSEKLGLIECVSSGVLMEESICDELVTPSYAWVTLDHDKISLRTLYEELLKGEPSIKTLYEPHFITNEAANRITLKVEYLLPGDKEIILERIKTILE